MDELTDYQKWSRKYFSAGISHEMWPAAVEHAFEAGQKSERTLNSSLVEGIKKLVEELKAETADF